MTKTAAYIRVSTNKQDNSKEVQVAEVNKYAKYKGITIDEWFVDQEISGFKPIADRPEGSKLTSLISEGRIGVVICTKIDRAFRNTADGILTREQWEKQGCHFTFLNVEGSSISTKTAVGKAMFTMLIMMAQFERDITSERTTQTLGHRKTEMKAYTREVFGYDNIDGQLIPNETEQITLDKIRLMKSLGSSMGATATYLNANGYRSKQGAKFYASTIKAIIENQIHNNQSAAA